MFGSCSHQWTNIITLISGPTSSLSSVDQHHHSHQSSLEMKVLTPKPSKGKQPPSEKKLPEKYNRKSTSKNKPTFPHIFHHFLSALVNNNQGTPTITALKSDLYTSMATWIEDGQGYLRYLDNARGVSDNYIQKELVLFRQYLTPTTFGLAIQDICLLLHDQAIISKSFIRKRVAYTLHYENVKSFLINGNNYNYQYEHPAAYSTLPRIETHIGSASPENMKLISQNDAIFYQFFQRILDSQPKNSDDDDDDDKPKIMKISGSKLFAQMRQFVFSKQRIIHDSNGPDPTTHHTTFQNIRSSLNITMFGVNMNRLLIRPVAAIKKLTNAGTVYVIDLEKLNQLILNQTNEES